MRLGMLTPSSNTVLEPVLAAILAGTPHTVHASRFRVTRIDLGEAARAQFDAEPILAAAELLADAQADSICWCGTSGGWLGLARDQALVEAITARTGIAACTATTGLIAAMRGRVRRIGLVTPYLGEVQDAIIRNLAIEGFQTVAERHLDDPGNYSFASHTAEHIAVLVRQVAAARPEAVVVFCTNFRGAEHLATLEAEIGVPVLDSVAVSLWAALLAARAQVGGIAGWGRLLGSGFL